MTAHRRRLLWIAYFTLCLWLLVVPVANAYIDPGSGSLVFQAVVAGAMAAGVAIKVKWQRFKSLFRRSEPSMTEPSPADDT